MLVATDDKAVDANSVYRKFFDNRFKILNLCNDRYAHHGATNHLALIIEHRNDAMVKGGTGANKFDVERGKPCRPDHDDVLDLRMVCAVRHRMVGIAEPRDGTHSDEPGGQDENVNEWRRARNAIKAGEGEKNQRGHEASGKYRFHDIDGILNRKMVRVPIAHTECQKRNQ